MAAAQHVDLVASLRRVRWAQGCAFGLIGLALVGTAAQSVLGVRRAAESLTVAQGRQFLDLLRAAHAVYGPGLDERLERLVEEHAESGLRCIGLLHPDHVRRGGECLLSEAEMRAKIDAAGIGEALRLGDRVVMIDHPPGHPGPGDAGNGRPPGPPFGGPRHAGPPGRPPGPGGLPPDHPDAFTDGRRPGPPPPPPPPIPILIEFEPRAAAALEGSVTLGALVAVVAVVVLLAGSLALWRLSRWAEQLQARVEQNRRLATLGEMASILAHEIRNPLAGLKGHAQLLAEQLPVESLDRQRAERVVRSAVRLEKLTQDLLSFVRSPSVEKRQVDPVALLRDAIAQVSDGGFEMTTNGAPEHWQIDPDRMHQVFVNLLQNAAEASPGDRHGVVSVAERGGALVIRLRDFGPGILAGEEQHIFEPFQTGRVEGTGLGLAVALRIVELHGGTLTARTHDAGGAEFEIVIP